MDYSMILHYLQAELEKTIDYFLDCTCRLTPRWFNKPKFHVLLHLPQHIRRFGPAMLFATRASNHSMLLYVRGAYIAIAMHLRKI